MPPPARVHEDLRTYLHPRYCNVYEKEWLPGEQALFGTENMPGYGCWQGEVLLLAQDCGVVKDLESRIKSGHVCPHGYGEKLPTNAKLRRLQTISPIPARMLYGSILGSLWRRGGGKSGEPPSWDEVLPAYAVPMVRWVVSQMDNIRAVACLGPYSWQGVMVASGRRYRFKREVVDEYRSCRDGQKWLDIEIPPHNDSTKKPRSVRVFAMWHPGARETYDILAMNRANLATFVSPK